MSSSLILSFNSAVAKYSRLTRKVRKSISKGEFWRYTRRKRHHVLARIERLRRRILELRMQVKLAGAGIAAGLLMMSSVDVSAQAVQSQLGPFTENPGANPFPRPAFDRVPYPVVTFGDLDSDGDLDATVSFAYNGTTPYYYINNGSKESPSFERAYYSGITWSDYATRGRIALGDVDDDGDLDAVVGMDRSGPWDYTEYADELLFFRNNALSPSDNPVFEPDVDRNPFAGIRLKREGWPAFTDYDNDGDLDLAVAGEYDDSSTGKTAWLQFFRNDKNGHSNGDDGIYTPLKGQVDNPLYIGESSTAGFYALGFADLDEDGDDDSFAIDQHGAILFRRNDGNGVFVKQTGAFVYKSNGASTGNPLEITGLVLYTPDSYKSLSFGDLDHDGDTDLVIGTNNVGTLHSPYIYVENKGNGVMAVDSSYSNPISGFTMGKNANAKFFDYDKDGDNDFIATGHIEEPTGPEGLTTDVISHAFFINNKGKFELQEDEKDPFAALTVDGSEGRWLIADADGDGDMDAVFIYLQYDASMFQDVVAIDYYRNDNGTFVIETGPDNAFKPVMDLKYFYMQMDIADINADGLPDVVIIGDSNIPKLFKNTGEIGSAAYTETPEWQDGLINEISNLNPKLVDLDGDGDTDLVLGKYFYMWYYENIGTPTDPKWAQYDEGSPENPFSQVESTSSYGDIWPEVADVDGDGDKDLMISKQGNNEYDGAFYYYENQNPPPVVTRGGQTDIPLVVSQPVALDPDVTLVDPDNDNIVKITVAISPYDAGLEKLQMASEPGHPNLDITWDDVTGVLTMTKSSTVAEYQAALRDVLYLYTGGSNSNNGRTIQKTVTVTVLDADQTVAPSNKATYNIGHTNVAPAITPASFNATFTATAIPVLPSITLTDDDDLTLFSAQVSFDPTSYKPAEDRLQMTLGGNISASFNQATGMLTLTGEALVTDYQAALQAVEYINVSGSNGTAGIRTLTVKVNDGEADSNIGSTQLTLNTTGIATNTPPTITGSSLTPFYANGDLVINNTIVVTDAEDVITGATISVVSGFTSGEDVLVFNDQNGIIGSYSSFTGVLTLTGSSSVANYQSALRSVRYRNSAADPNTTNRGITFTVTDSTSTVSFTGTAITINKPPVIKTDTKREAASNGNVTFPLSAFTDPDGNLDLETLQVTSKEGTVSIANGIITVDYGSRANAPGTDNITITICDTGGRCKTQNIEVELGAAAIIYTGMSPNGDGINDWFCIENLPQNTHVAVYDRWGDAIFETGNYDMTEPSQRFEGKNKNGTDVVAGSYFYKVKFPDSNGVKTGYIILNR